MYKPALCYNSNMSFNTDIKADLTKNIPNEYNTAFATLYAMIYCGFSVSIKGQGKFILVYETTASVCASYAFKLIKAVFGYSGELVKIKKKDNFGEKSLYKLSIEDPQICMEILHSYNMLSNEGLSFDRRIDLSLINTEEAESAFMRGVFITVGYMYDPMKSFGIDFRFSNEAAGESFCEYLNKHQINAKIRQLNNVIIVYIKKLEEITDFLSICGAFKYTLMIEDRSAMHQMRSDIQRRTNCETANLNKTVNASVEQTEAINKIIISRGLSSLSEPLREAAQLRLDNPSASLKELSLISNINRSTLDKRLRKIMQIAEGIK